MGFIFGVERTLKFPLMISIRRRCSMVSANTPEQEVLCLQIARSASACTSVSFGINLASANRQTDHVIVFDDLLAMLHGYASLNITYQKHCCCMVVGLFFGFRFQDIRRSAKLCLGLPPRVPDCTGPHVTSTLS